jgi:hypothetical protein
MLKNIKIDSTIQEAKLEYCPTNGPDESVMVSADASLLAKIQLSLLTERPTIMSLQ